MIWQIRGEGALQEEAIALAKDEWYEKLWGI